MMPAMCVPCPNGSPETLGSCPTKLTLATTRPPSAECSAMPESMMATPMPLPERPGFESRPMSPLDAGPDLVRPRDLVGDRHVGDDRQVTRDVGDTAVGDEAVQVRVGDIERQGSGELAPEPPAEAVAERGERALLRLHDHAHARSARQGRFQILGNRRAPLSFGMSRRQHRPTNRATKRTIRRIDTPLEDTSTMSATRAPRQLMRQEAVPFGTCGRTS